MIIRDFDKTGGKLGTSQSLSRGKVFHGKLDGETRSVYRRRMRLSDFEEGFILGILVGEGHFGGDGLQPQVTLRMHTRHAELFHWLTDRVPGSRLYGPYHHGGRDYYQWMIRGKALREEMLPLLTRRIDLVDAHVRERITGMMERYGLGEQTPDR
jgi:hypothetical protein